MDFFGEITKTLGHYVTLKLDDDVDMREVKKLIGGQNAHAHIELEDKRLRTFSQLKKSWALIHDISNWSGYTVEETERVMKKQYSLKNEKPIFTQRTASIETEKDFIQTMLDFCFEWDIPFTNSSWDLMSSDYGFQFNCLMHRRCVICGQPAQFCHIETVGMGNNRLKIDHSQHHLMALCVVHHHEQHNGSVWEFIKSNHIKPIMLNYDQLVELGIMTFKRVTYFKEQKLYLETIGYFKEQEVVLDEESN